MLKLNLTSVLIAVLFTALIGQTGKEWNSLGLEDHHVNCLLTSDTTRILAGTDKGLHVLFQERWYQVEGLPSNLPVKALVRVSDTKVIAAVGNGSRSDGIYMGEAVIKGPPFYSFTLVDYLLNPQKLTAPRMNKDTVFIGTPQGVFMVLKDKNGDYSDLGKIPSPPYSFGVEMPLCAALLHSGRNFGLWAGGYDSSPLPGPGSLLLLAEDSMITMKSWDVTSMAEVIWGAGPMEYHDLYVSVKDSGVLKFDPVSSARPWMDIGSPGGETVRHMTGYAYSVTQAGPLNLLHVAVLSGIYSRNTDTGWTVLGNIPAPPTFLASDGGFGIDLYAGTEKGVYRYMEKPTSALGQTPAVELSFSVRHSHVETLCLLDKPGHVHLEVTNIAGRTVVELADRHFGPGHHFFRWNIKDFRDRGGQPGVYLVKITADKKSAVYRLVIY